MKYNIANKVEFLTEKNDWDSPSECRYVYYRIVPSELPFWGRIFGNPWRCMYHPFKAMDGTNYLYSFKDFKEEIQPLKTFGDVHNYLKTNRDKIEVRHFRMVANDETWPD